MRKVIVILAIAALTACGGKGTTEGTTDSTVVVLDSTAISATDSTTAEIPTEVAPVEVK